MTDAEGKDALTSDDVTMAGEAVDREAMPFCATVTCAAGASGGMRTTKVKMTALPTAGDMVGVGDDCSSRRCRAAARLGPHWTIVLASQPAGAPVAAMKALPMAARLAVAAAHDGMPATTMDRVVTS